MSAPYIPPYTPKEGSFGKKIMDWIYALPFIGDFLQGKAARWSTIDSSVKNATNEQLIYCSQYAGGDCQEAANLEIA